jgi:hypothetical protein
MPAFELHRFGFPAKAASAIGAGIPVTYDVADTQRQVVAVASRNVEPFGVTLATAANPGDSVTVMERGNVIKAVAMASIGAGAPVGVGSSNGALTLVAAGASGAVVWQVGVSMSAAAAAETFSFYVNPRQLSGNAP